MTIYQPPGTGPTGATGATGPTGATGATGATGSQPTGALIAADFLFTEQNLAALGTKTYTATLALAANCRVMAILLTAESGVRASDTALLDINDVTVGNGAYLTNFDLTAFTGGPYNPNTFDGDFNPPDSGVTDVAAIGSSSGAYYNVTSMLAGNSNSVDAPGVRYPSGDTITMEVTATSVGGDTGVGILRITIIYFTAAAVGTPTIT